MDKHEIVRRYARALETRNVEASSELMHPDIVARYPQSGEVIRGRDNYLGMLRAYPNDLPDATVMSVTGSSKTAIVPSTTPFSQPTVTVFGGDQFVVEGVATYPDGSVYNVVWILELRDGMVAEETSYYAEPFPAPDWRRPYVEE
jgi:ketosteroid isomerase-like protein